MTHIIISIIILAIAIVYSSAGFGGGSLYLALLSQLGYSIIMLRFTALLCNAVVTLNGMRAYHTNGFLQWKQILLLLAASVPLCAWSASFDLREKTYLVLLACCLLLSAMLMLLQKSTVIENIESKNQWWHYPLSMGIGFLSGLTGIGGGVYLSPMLHLSKWGSPKQIAAASSLFILVNSITAIVVILVKGGYDEDYKPLVFALVALTGSFIGSNFGTSILSQRAVRYVTIALLIFASVRILIKYL